jgi:predicted lipoprotein with Yx(FWY)xxD motif
VVKNSSVVTALAGSLLVAMLAAGCGAGAYGGSSSTYHVPGPNPSPTQSATVPLSTATLNGAPGFVNQGNFTVYVFDADLAAPGQSTCNGACAQNWPPLVAPAGALPAPWGAIARQDASMQLTYKGRPMYTFVVDQQPGQTNGDGVNAFGGIWHIARP